MAQKKLPWFKKRILGVPFQAPRSFELSDEQYSTIERAGEIRLGTPARIKLSALLRQYQLDYRAWSSAPRPAAVKDILERLLSDSRKLRVELQRLLHGGSPPKEATLYQLIVNAPAPSPTSLPRYGWPQPRSDWLSWLEETLLRVTLFESMSRLSLESLVGENKGGRNSNEFLRGVIRSLHELFSENGGQDEHLFGRNRRGPFIKFVEAALGCVPALPETKALSKTIWRTLNESHSRGQNPSRKS